MAIDAVIESVLEDCSATVRAAIERYVTVSFDSDELQSLVLDYPSRPGKALRPALLLAACEAYGGWRPDAMGAAVAVEMLHNAFLIHDDIEDDSPLRRGHPTLHRLVGTPMAVQTGDALAVGALLPLLQRSGLSSRLRQQVLAEFLTMARLTLEGQQLELRWRADGLVALTAEDYVDLVGLKTAAYTTVLPLRAGAIIGSCGSAPLRELTRFAYLVGVAFQLRDDLLDVETGRHGKARLNDLREGKRTLMLIHLASRGDAAVTRWLERFLGKPPSEREDDEVAYTLRLMEQHGSIEYAWSFANRLNETAMEAFDQVFRELPPSPSADFIRLVVPYMTDRVR